MKRIILYEKNYFTPWDKGYVEEINKALSQLEKDLHSSPRRLAYQAFFFGFTKGIDTKKSNE